MDAMRCFCTRIRSHHIKVVLLDEQELIQEIQDTTPGQEILDTVFRHLNLLETAYFGLRYLDSSNQTHWLDPAKNIAKQLKGTDPFTLYFGVKFYAADPCKLLEEITRYQFFLQVKQDILQGRLPVTFDLAAELGSYVVQSELGDYDPRRNSPGYVSEFRFLSNQTVELESRIGDLHKGLIGQLPSVAELSYLDKVKWLEMYGVDLHPVLGEDNVEYFLGLTPSGIIVLRNKNKVGNYYWPRISKIYFKGRYFMLRVCDKNNDENTYGFETPSKPACKHLWKCCVEHHAFFRLVQVTPTSPDIFALGSRFRYSGRTEKQAQRDVQLRVRSPPQFTRTPSRRYQRRIVEGAQDAPKVDEYENNENIPPHEKSAVPIQPPLHSGSMYRSTCSIPAALPTPGRADSPRSTRSAPWTQPQVRGLYTSASPRSVRSAGNNSQLLSRLTRRSSSVESQSSNDSRSHKRHRHRSRRGSDNESELSKSSNRSHGNRRHRRRSHGTRRDSGSEQDHHHRHRHKGSSRHRHGSHYELVDSEAQWKEVQRRQAEGGTGIHQATVTPSARRSGYMNSGMETESEMSYLPKRNKQRKHRSRSRSPDGKARLPHELKSHLKYDLIDTEGMSEAQLREIPYKNVETNGKPRAKHSPSSKRHHRSPRRSKSSTQEERSPPANGDSPPPPYTPPQKLGATPSQPPEVPPTPKTSSLANLTNGNTGESSPRTATPNGLPDFISKNSGSSSGSHSPSGSMRARNANNNSINNINNNNQLPRLPTNYGGPNRSHPTPAARSYPSALYDNTQTMIGKLNGHAQPHWQNINNLKAQPISHEHSDSGLSAESHEFNPYSGARPLIDGMPKYAQTTKISSMTPPLPLPAFVSPPSVNGRNGHQQTNYRHMASPAPVNSNVHNTSLGTPRSHHFGSVRSPASDIQQSVAHQRTPSLDAVNRHWEARKSGRNMGNGASGGLSFAGIEGLYSSPSAAQSAPYRPMVNGASAAPSPASNNNNWSRDWNGSLRSTRSGDGYRRGPAYYQQQSPVNSNSSILRDSNKFNTSAMIGSGCWIGDTDIIREVDEPVEPTNAHSRVYRMNGNLSPVKHMPQLTNNPISKGNQEITHEMSTEL